MGGVGHRVIAWSLLFPVVWLVGTLVRGALVGFWPYPFLDADELGWTRALVDCGLVAVLFAVLAVAAARLDRVLPGGRPAAGAQGASDRRSSPPPGRT